MNVLIVDSSRVVAHMLSTVFGQHGMAVRVARSGAEGLMLLKEAPADLLCFSYELGDMNGIEFFVTAKANKFIRHQPGVMFSSTQSKAVLNRALESGVTECFSKRNVRQFEEFVGKFAAHRRIGGTVLLVEDSQSMAIYYRRILEGMGLQVDHYPSAEAAIERFAAQAYSLVITDYVLAGSESGFSVIRAVRHAEGRKSATPILAVSAFDDMARKIEVLRHGANDFMSKPVLAEELEVRVSNLLTLQRLMRQLESQNETMKDMAMRDPLTGLHNRYYLAEIAPGLISETQEAAETLALMVLDIDHFKNVNDTLGHRMGDRVLEQVALQVKGMCRTDDLVARVGGEEFIVMLPGVDLDTACVRAETLRQSVEALRPGGVAVTVSIGVAALAPRDTYDDLFRRADEAVYDAKKMGRNRVMAREAHA